MKKSVSKSVSKSAVKAAAKPVAKPAERARPEPAERAKAPAKKAASPAKNKAVAEPPATFISAQIDIGFGNHLTLRGEGPGLSWDRGLVMDNVGQNLWTASVKGATQPVVFKVLVNDLTWNTGNDYAVEPGQSITVYPSF
jgi:hypothetical protein